MNRYRIRRKSMSLQLLCVHLLYLLLPCSPLQSPRPFFDGHSFLRKSRLPRFSASSDDHGIHSVTDHDITYMKQAIAHARLGLGNTYPNPAVGCVLVSHNSTTDTIIGRGFHPKAGYPHAEIFALWEACGFVFSGIDAAQTVVTHTCTDRAPATLRRPINSNTSYQSVLDLSQMYANPKYGPKHFFSNMLVNKNVTAYVTLEPCSHYGRTPPCAMSLVEAGVARVVVGFRDPNPKVNGGGVSLLRNQNIQVTVLPPDDSSECYSIIQSFVKRIAPRKPMDNDGFIESQYDVFINGAKRSSLRSLAGSWKQQGTMTEFDWPKHISSSLHLEEDSIIEDIKSIQLNHNWMEEVDAAMWEKEMVLLRLNQAASKKKYVKVLGERLACELGAHLVQVVGHTVLLYRPGRPPILNLEVDG